MYKDVNYLQQIVLDKYKIKKNKTKHKTKTKPKTKPPNCIESDKQKYYNIQTRFTDII